VRIITADAFRVFKGPHNDVKLLLVS
jgi:hypothetical protein